MVASFQYSSLRLISSYHWAPQSGMKLSWSGYPREHLRSTLNISAYTYRINIAILQKGDWKRTRRCTHESGLRATICWDSAYVLEICYIHTIIIIIANDYLTYSILLYNSFIQNCMLDIINSSLLLVAVRLLCCIITFHNPVSCPGLQYKYIFTTNMLTYRHNAPIRRREKLWFVYEY